MQITKAMELVASSKMRRAKERAAERAARTSTPCTRLLRDLASVTRDSDSVYTRRREVKNSLYIVIAGDRGLAGGYNSERVQAGRRRDARAGTPSVIPIGKKAQEHYASSVSVPVAAELPRRCRDHAHQRYASRSSGHWSRPSVRAGQIEVCRCCYTEFVSPLAAGGRSASSCCRSASSERRTRTSGGAHVLTEYEPSPEAVFDAVIPEYLYGVLYGAVVRKLLPPSSLRAAWQWRLRPTTRAR